MTLKILDRKIYEILMKLEKQSQIEKNLVVPEHKRMLAIPYETGKFLNILLKCIHAKNILEIGTSVGYSTLWLAEAVHKDENCKIITIENDLQKTQKAQINFQKAGIADKIQIKHGNAINVLKEITDTVTKVDFKFDFAFIDADKDNVTKYFDYILLLIKINGIIITDNIMYPTKYATIMKAYIDHIKKIKNVFTTTLHIGNGEELSIRIG